MSRPAIVHVAFGGNIGAVEETLRRALKALGEREGVGLRRLSSLYRTAPVGVTEQAEFLNGAAELETLLEPEGLLDVLLAVEAAFGRMRQTRWGPRTVDLDLVLWGDRVVRTRRLEIPHPRMHERAFVLVPLAEIAPEAVHPTLHRTCRQLCEALGRAPGIVALGRPPWADALEKGRD